MMDTPNPFGNIRLNNIFSGMGANNSPENPDNGVVTPRAGDMNGYDAVSRMMELYKPQNDATQQYLQTLKSPPNPNDYKPSRLRQIGAVLAGMGTGGPVGISGGSPIGYQANPTGAMQVSQAYARQPYNQAMTDYSNKANLQGMGAQMEQSQNTANRGFAEQVVRNELTDKLRETQQENANTAKKKESDIGEFKYADLQRRVEEAEQKSQEFQQKFEADQTNKAALQQFHDAQLAAEKARWELDRAQRDTQYNTTLDRLNKEHQDKMNQLQAQLDEAKHLHDINASPTDRTTTVTRDSSGQPIGSTTRTSRNVLPRAAVSHTQETAQNNTGQPKEGDTREIPGFPGTQQVMRNGRWIRTK